MKRRIEGGRHRRGSRLWNWALPLACLLPWAVSATVDISADNGGGDPAGDPLDSNDVGAGGGHGERYQSDPRWPGVNGAVWPGPMIGGRRVLLIPVNQGGLLTFRLVIIEEVVVVTQEAADAR